MIPGPSVTELAIQRAHSDTHRSPARVVHACGKEGRHDNRVSLGCNCHVGGPKKESTCKCRNIEVEGLPVEHVTSLVKSFRKNGRKVPDLICLCTTPQLGTPMSPSKQVRGSPVN